MELLLLDLAEEHCLKHNTVIRLCDKYEIPRRGDFPKIKQEDHPRVLKAIALHIKTNQKLRYKKDVIKLASTAVAKARARVKTTKALYAKKIMELNEEIKTLSNQTI